MRIRLFRAARTAEAMAMIRTELGDEAVILETRRIAGGVEVTAAIEAPDPVMILPDAPPPPAPAVLHPPADLAWHKLPAGVGARLAGSADLPRRLAETLRFAPLPDGRARPLLLAGPPGAGKTLTCAKLATRAVLEGARPLVITTDAARAGAAEQLAAFTRLLGLPLALAEAPGTLAKAVRAHRQPGQPVLVDSAGCDPFVAEEAEALLALAGAIEAELVLVLPAGLDPDEAVDLARRFAELGARHLVPTRLDHARRLGAILAAAAEGGMALTEAGIGPGATEGLAQITAAWLAERLLRPRPGTEESRP